MFWQDNPKFLNVESRATALTRRALRASVVKGHITVFQCHSFFYCGVSSHSHFLDREIQADKEVNLDSI